MQVWKPFRACSLAAQTLREELAELKDAGLQLVGTDHRGAAGLGAAVWRRPSPGTTSKTDGWRRHVSHRS